MQKRISNFGELGVNTDIQDTLLPEAAVNEIFNCRTRDHGLHSVYGQKKVIDLSCRPLYHVDYLDTSQEQWVIISDGFVVWAESIHGFSENITPPTGDWTGGRVTFANLNGVLVVNSASNGPFYWSGPQNVLTPLRGPGDGTVAILDAMVDADDPATVAAAINVFDWTGHPKADGTKLNIWSGDLIIFKVEDSAAPGTYYYYDYIGTRPVTVGLGGAYTVVGGDLVDRVITPADIQSLENGWNWDKQWRCLEIAALRYNLFALGMMEDNKEFLQKFRWSNSAQEGEIPLEWSILLTNDAGDDLLGETSGKIVTSRNSRDQLYVVKEDAIYSTRWIGGQYVFQTTRLEGGVGTRLPDGCVEMRGRMITLTTGDVLSFDGQNSDSMVDGRVRKLLAKTISQEFWDRSHVFFDPPTSLLLVGGAKSGSIGQLTDALIYSLEENTWSHVHLGFSYGFDSAFVTFSSGQPTWDELGDTDHITCDFDEDTLEPENCTGAQQAQTKEPGTNWIPGVTWDEQIDGTWNQGVSQPSVPSVVVYEANDEDTAWWLSVLTEKSTYSDNKAKTCRVRRTGIPFLGSSRLVQINEVWPELQGEMIEVDENGDVVIDPNTGQNVRAPLRLRIGVQDVPHGPVTWATDLNGRDYFDVWPNQGIPIDPCITGRYLCWELESFAAGWWHLGALTFEFEDAGVV